MEDAPTTFLPYFIDVLDLYRGERVSNMESLLSALGIPSSSHHSPLEDAYMTALILKTQGFSTESALVCKYV
ncbi:MAG: hypothetical protein ACP5P0_05125 [Hydrogenobacter sp.]